MVENADLERKEIVDLDSREHVVKLVREIAAFLNSGGGTLVIGVTDDGTEVGLDPALAGKLDPARLGDLVDGFIAPDRAEIAVHRRALPDGRLIVSLAVAAADAPPVVMCKQGNYHGERGQLTCFAAHSVFVRRNTKAEPARWEDFRRWREDAVRRARDAIIERLTMVVEAPADSQIRVLTVDEVHDAPSFLLSRSADVFRQSPGQLLSASDLKYLWSHRASLEIDHNAAELIFHSALRRRATLWLWLATLGLSSGDVEAFLTRSLSLRDRDKSDAARSMLQVAAIYLDHTGYERIRSALASSEYSHMQTAARDLPDPASAMASTPHGGPLGAELSQKSVEELADLARRVLDEDDAVASRRLPPIGWEYFVRSRGTLTAAPAQAASADTAGRSLTPPGSPT